MATRSSFQSLAKKLINNTFGDFRDSITFNLMGDLDYATQTTPIISTSETVGIRLEYSASQFGGSIQVGDYMVILEEQTVNFDVRTDNVNMIFNGKEVEIVSVSGDPARAALTIQCRDK